jgi:hypothetical protein
VLVAREEGLLDKSVYDSPVNDAENDDPDASRTA